MRRSFCPSVEGAPSVVCSGALVKKAYCCLCLEAALGRRSIVWRLDDEGTLRKLHDTRCIVVTVPFHSNPSCSLKNSRKAGSSFN